MQIQETQEFKLHEVKAVRESFGFRISENGQMIFLTNGEIQTLALLCKEKYSKEFLLEHYGIKE